MLFDHIDMRVRDLTRTRPLYDALLPAMGYSQINADEESAGYHQPNEIGDKPFIWLVQEGDHTPNGTRIAFAAQTRGEVDRLAQLAKNSGAQAFEAPALVREYGPNYYAAFFEDAEGNKIEICCRKPQ
jgi:predicted lactoylglutathione lyase